MFISGQRNRNRNNSTQSRKFSTGRASLVFAAALAAAVGYGAGTSNTATATTLYWTGSTTGTALADTSGNWDTTAGNTVWSTASTGGTASLWTNGDIADLGAGGTSAVTVTIDTTGITATGLTFNAMGVGGSYTIAGTSTDNLTLSGTITMNANGTISAPIVGTGALTIVGPDTLTLSGLNTYSGGTTINAGATINVTSTGAITGAVVDNGTFDVNDGFAITNLTGSGAMALGTSVGLTVVPTAADTFSGTLTGAAGTELDASGTTGSLTLTGNLSGFAGQYRSAGTLTLNGSTLLNSAATLTIAANGTINVAYSNINSNVPTFSGNTTNGFLNFVGSNATGTLGIGSSLMSIADTSGTTTNTIDAGGMTNTLSIASPIQSANTAVGGSNTLVLQNGNFILGSGNNNTDFIDNGTLQIGNGTLAGTAQFSAATNLPGSSVGIALDDGTLNYTGTGNVTVLNGIKAIGSSTTGVLENSSASGTETITGAINSGSAGNTLAFSGGTFNLNEVGLGTGTFQIGDAPSTVIVSNPDAFGSGAILLTTGSTLETTNIVTNTGTAIGITGGSYTQQTGSALALVANSPTIYDSIQLGGGSASLNGTLNLIFDGVAPLTGQHYVVIGTTGSVTGTFSSVVLGGLAPVTAHGLATYVAGTGEEIYIEAQYFSLTSLTPNQAAVAGYLNTNAIASGTPTAIVNVLNAISLLPQSQQGAYLNLLTPQDYAQLPTQAFQNSTFMEQEVFGQVQNAFEGGGFNTSGLTILKTTDQNPFSISMDAAMNSARQQATNSAAYLDSLPGVGPEVPTQERISDRFSGFILGTITMDKLPENSGFPSEHFTTGGVLTGLDYRLTKNLVVGALFNWNYTGGTMDNVGSRQQTSSYTPGLFAGYSKGGFYADGLLSYTYNSYKLNRNVAMPTSTTVATGEPDSNQYDAAALAGYYLTVAHGLKIGPALGAGFTQMNVSGFNETGSPFDLSVSKQHADSLRSLLGMQGSYAFHIGANPLPISINFNAFWQHEFLNSSRNISATFSSLGGGSFLYSTPGPSRDSALLGLGASGYVCKNVSLFVNYETQIGAKSQFAQTVMAGVGVSF